MNNGMRHATAAMCLMSALFAAKASAQAITSAVEGGEIQVNRYTTLSAEPQASISNPLGVLATVTFPRGHINTVGEAIRYLLLRTGYRVVDQEALGQDVQNVMALPLPESHRRLGPYRVDAMLSVLLSAPYKLEIQHLDRTVKYTYTQPAPPVPPAPPEPKPVAPPAPPVTTEMILP